MFENKVTLYCGDANTILKTLPDESIDCCITSPPYWGLRDYGTAKWDGGDPNCGHIDKGMIGGQGELSKKQHTSQGTQQIQYKNKCELCGAARIDNQLGLEKTPEEYVAKMVEVFREVKRCLKKEGTLWLNLGDSYAGCGRGCNTPKQKSNRGTNGMPDSIIPKGLKAKDLVGIPWRVAFALQSEGWYLRQDIIWRKPNPMPESVTDRCTKAHEYIFLLSKNNKYYFNYKAIKEPVASSTPARLLRGVSNHHKNINGAPGQTPHSINKPRLNHKNLMEDGQSPNSFHLNRAVGNQDKQYELRNKRSVWTVTTKPFKGAHFATFPEDLILPCVLAGCPKDGVILDCFCGAGTTGVVALKNNRKIVGIELSQKYIDEIIIPRLKGINNG